MTIRRTAGIVALTMTAVLVSVALSSGAAHAQADPTEDPPASTQASPYRMLANPTNGEPPAWYTCSIIYDGNSRALGGACFRPFGDEFWITDTRRDGLYIQMDAFVVVPGEGMRDYKCYTYSTSFTGWHVCRGSYWAGNIPEGDNTISFRAELHSLKNNIWTLKKWGVMRHSPTA